MAAGGPHPARSRGKEMLLLRFVASTAIFGAVLIVASALPATSDAAPSALLSLPSVELQPLVSGLSSPVHVTNAGDGSGRLFIVERDGRIKIIRNGALLGADFLDISARVLSGGERGLLSVAFPPGYSGKGYFYVNYTRDAPGGDPARGATRVSRFFISGDPDLADSATEQVLLEIPQPAANHNGGQLQFGPDGLLYIGMGDGGGSGGGARSQDRNDLLGKLLRIDTEADPGNPQPSYLIPPGNPTLGSAQPDAVLALGLRNPWRFSFDRNTGDLFIADVGEGSFEEINHRPAGGIGGENYEWDCREGPSSFNDGRDCTLGAATPPVASYSHGVGPCDSITGGYVYRGAAYPALQGAYFYADYCDGRLWALVWTGSAWETQQLADVSQFQVVSFGEDEAGELYVAMLSAGEIRRLAAVCAAATGPAGPPPLANVVYQPAMYRSCFGAGG